MRDKPIIFSAPMVRALLDGRKSMTRRVLKPQPEPFDALFSDGGKWWTGDAETGEIHQVLRVPYAPGDRLYVREALRMGFDAGTPICQATYAADAAPLDLTPDGAVAWAERRARNAIPSIHMPRWASRLTLTVTDVRVQRACELTDSDAISEGIEVTHGCSPLVTYARLWDELNAKRGFPWQRNPWVVALTFRTELNSARSHL